MKKLILLILVPVMLVLGLIVKKPTKVLAAPEVQFPLFNNVSFGMMSGSARSTNGYQDLQAWFKLSGALPGMIPYIERSYGNITSNLFWMQSGSSFRSSEASKLSQYNSSSVYDFTKIYWQYGITRESTDPFFTGKKLMRIEFTAWVMSSLIGTISNEYVRFDGGPGTVVYSNFATKTTSIPYDFMYETSGYLPVTYTFFIDSTAFSETAKYTNMYFYYTENHDGEFIFSHAGLLLRDGFAVYFGEDAYTRAIEDARDAIIENQNENTERLIDSINGDPNDPAIQDQGQKNQELNDDIDALENAEKAIDDQLDVNSIGDILTMPSYDPAAMSWVKSMINRIIGLDSLIFLAVMVSLILALGNRVLGR